MGLFSRIRQIGRRPLSTLLLAFILVAALCMIYLGYQVATLPLDRDSTIDKGKMSILEGRLHKVERELWRNHQVLSKLSDAMERIQLKKQEQHISEVSLPTSVLPKKLFPFSRQQANIEKVANNQSLNVIWPLSVISDVDCPSDVPLASNPDIQMVDFYEKISFDNVDGGVWKQGWPITYEETQWSDSSKLKVFVVPHSHNDPGWLKTFEKYYLDHTRHIFNNMVKKLAEDERRKMIWAETSYLALFWERSSSEQKMALKQFVDNGQLEIVTGGWVMNDEAVSHYFAMIEQMMEGHEWLQNHLGYIPENGWAIDPFGLSPTMAYLLKRMGLSHMVIQRVHYSVKKHLAKYKNLEFFWRQEWDFGNITDMFCHMMPFYSYDIPHTCGPDPLVCCQFDFKRLAGGKVNCPWKVPPQPITEKNVREKANLLLDQYRKKAQLFRTNVILVPLGDDFRYDKTIEWDQQYSNYQRLFDYMNQQSELNVQAQFGTLHDYFNALETEMFEKKLMLQDEFPSITGDFFTYSDRDDHYWSGYFSSRPLFKNMDRSLEAYLRSAEIIFSTLLAHLALNRREQNFPVGQLLPQLVSARRNLGLFQHHDAITGTSRDPVVVDYGNRLLQSIADLHEVIGRIVGAVLSPVGREMDTLAIAFDLDDNRASYSSISKKTLIQLSPEGRTVVFYNSLGQNRQELVSLLVSVPRVCIFDSSDRIVHVQVNPVWNEYEIAEDQFEVIFLINVPALGLSSYTLKISSDDSEISKCYTFSRITLHNVEPVLSQQLWKFHVGESVDFTLKNSMVAATFSPEGLLRTLTTLHDNTSHTVALSFLMYGTRNQKDKSGAYLFLPGGEATPIDIQQPLLRIVEGPIFSEVRASLPHIEHVVQLKNSPGVDGFGVDVLNFVDITREKNQEIVMRVETSIVSDKDFFTDLNGFQMIHRKTFDKLPIQANFYPISAMAYIEDSTSRFTILTAQPLGGASLQSGWLEIVLDRRLNQDDNRGLQQGLLDNKLTPSHFRFLIERRSSAAVVEEEASNRVALPSLTAHMALQSLLYPVIRLIVMSESGSPALLQNFLPSFSPLKQDFPCDLHLLHLRTSVSERLGEQDVLSVKNTSVMLLHRLGFDCHIYTPQLNCQMSRGKVNLNDLLGGYFKNEVTETTLTSLYEMDTFPKTKTINLLPMEISAYKLFR